MAHPLDGAQLRFERADRHLSEADDLIRAFADRCKQYVVIQREDDKVGFSLFADFATLDPMLPVVIGDAIHNMRASLDYIVFELAKLDSPDSFRRALSSSSKTSNLIPPIPKSGSTFVANAI